MLHQCASYYSLKLADTGRLNHGLLTGYKRYVEDVSTRRTHQYQGRYENIYFDKDKIPEIELVLHYAIAAVSDVVNMNKDLLRAGLWFNAMPPGSRTLKHAHDDNDEVMSAVYYVNVPENSGDLILYSGKFITHITPEAGTLVLFPPDVPHEVTENRSSEMRLSLGINIGPIDALARVCKT